MARMNASMTTELNESMERINHNHISKTMKKVRNRESHTEVYKAIKRSSS